MSKEFDDDTPSQAVAVNLECSMALSTLRANTGISNAMTDDEVLARLDFAMMLSGVVKELLKTTRAAVLRRIIETGRNLPVRPGVEYRAITPRTVKCLDVRKAMEAILTAAGGDWDAMCGCLSSEAIKHGAAGKILSEAEFERLFVVTFPPTLKEHELPVKRLAKVDTAFVKGRK